MVKIIILLGLCGVAMSVAGVLLALLQKRG